MHDSVHAECENERAKVWKGGIRHFPQWERSRTKSYSSLESIKFSFFKQMQTKL